ncbi:hypothetical protein HDU76_012205, partial [Blyttiomyces sp. JEL0837]
FGNLKSLKVLDLSACQLEGVIPTALGDLHNLNVLFLGNNDLIGIVPDTFANLTKLNQFDVSGNCLKGDVPIATFSLGDQAANCSQASMGRAHATPAATPTDSSSSGSSSAVNLTTIIASVAVPVAVFAERDKGGQSSMPELPAYQAPPGPANSTGNLPTAAQGNPVYMFGDQVYTANSQSPGNIITAAPPPSHVYDPAFENPYVK